MPTPITIENARTSRRSFLRGAGVCLALPWLESLGSTASAVERGVSAKRMLLISNNLGVLPRPFFPDESGQGYALSPYLAELQEFQQDFTVFSGLSHPGVVGGHSTENCFLTAARGPTRSGFRNKISFDQFVADAIGQQTRFSTINLGVNIDKANRSLAWTRDGALLPAEDSPAALFNRLFVSGSPQEQNRRIHELRLQGSILDALSEQSRALSGRIGQNDRRRVDQYFESIRQLERRLQIANDWEHRPKPTTDREPPKDIMDEALFFEKFELMLSMAQIAFESDSTRIVTLMLDAFATGVFQIDAATQSINAYHNLSHHGNIPEKVKQLEQVDHRQMRLLGKLLRQLSEVEESGNRLLDSSMVLYGSNMGDANTHENTNLPILLAGGGFKHGNHLAFDRENNTPLCNLFVTMAQQMGVETDSFGSSNGRLQHLDRS